MQVPAVAESVTLPFVRPKPAGPDSNQQNSRTLKESEREQILAVLQSCNGNIQEAAKILQIHRNTLSRKMRAHQIKKPRSGSRQAAVPNPDSATLADGPAGP